MSGEEREYTSLSEHIVAPRLRVRLLYFVPRRGLEPPRPCGRYHLKVVPLPISPPGQWKYYKRKTASRKAAGRFSFLEIYTATSSVFISSLGATASSLMRCIMRA